MGHQAIVFAFREEMQARLSLFNNSSTNPEIFPMTGSDRSATIANPIQGDAT
jgi:hypothetical protein